ncbi:uncharacterized protein B0T23DRAFT_27365 [Neurospora hispaniola]|uniref:Uncharacterized protein n=1 Tax=Neurospora hispaniola TaxID=588809 RepID=A0AAJ0IHA0_9PEZI|nr:hypothetical protein B0T23DRAFT_27365 [Neurospora hispaniola]
MGVLDGEESPPTYYELPHELTWLQKWKTRSAISRRGCLENGKKGLPDSSFHFYRHTHHHPIPILVVFQPLFAGSQPLLPFPPRYSILLLRFKGGHGITRPTRKWLISARGPFLVEP